MVDSASSTVSQAIAANSTALTKVRMTGTNRSRGFSSGRSRMSTATCPPSQPHQAMPRNTIADIANSVTSIEPLNG